MAALKPFQLVALFCLLAAILWAIVCVVNNRLNMIYGAISFGVLALAFWLVYFYAARVKKPS